MINNIENIKNHSESPLIEKISNSIITIQQEGFIILLRISICC